jgi:glyoxylase-like metal-dependent hydrolase (beta-lactamase superfamily II)
VLWQGLVADEIDAKGRLLQALNILVIESPGGRVLVETGIGERLDERGRAWRELAGEPVVPALERAGVEPASIDIVALSHLHYDHAGGLLRADGRRAFPNARIVAQRAEWEIALIDNPRIVASYDQPELRLVREWGEAGAADGEVELVPRVWAVPTGGHSYGHQAIIVRAPGRTLAFLGDIAMRPWSANPRWITAFDDFPLDSVAQKAAIFARAAAEGWTIVLSHERRKPVGHLVPDGDRFAWQPI